MDHWRGGSFEPNIGGSPAHRRGEHRQPYIGEADKAGAPPFLPGGPIDHDPLAIISSCGDDFQDGGRLASFGFLPGRLSCLRYSITVLGLTNQSRPGLIPEMIPRCRSHLTWRAVSPDWRAA